MIELIGEPAMLEQLAEEASELAQAALKATRRWTRLTWNHSIRMERNGEKMSTKLVRYKDVCVALITMIAGAIEKGAQSWRSTRPLRGRKGRRDQTMMNIDEEEKDIRVCPVCGKEVERPDMSFTHDCHGIPFRLVCFHCWKKLMSKGYDGEYYTEADEQIEPDY